MTEFHDLANAFPLLEGAEFDELVASIRDRGQLEPIVLFEGKILDGRNRYRACVVAGVEPHREEFEGTFEEARDFVIDANLRRRHLDASQRAMIAAKLATLGDGQRQIGKFADVPTQPEAAERLNVSERSVRDARRVLDHGEPELVQAVERGEVAVSKAAKIVAEIVAERAAKVTHDCASSPDLPPAGENARPLRNLVNLSGGELARWIKVTTPNDRPHVIRVLRMAADILESEGARMVQPTPTPKADAKAPETDPVAGPKVIEVNPRSIGVAPYAGNPDPEYLKARKAIRDNAYAPVPVLLGGLAAPFAGRRLATYKLIRDDDLFLMRVAVKMWFENKCPTVRVIVVEAAIPSIGVAEMDNRLREPPP